MSYYTTKKVLEIIENYQLYKSNLSSSREYASVGVSQYGIEATLPKGNNISNVVELEAIRGIEELPYFAAIRTDVKYLDDRLGRVTDNLDIEILGLRLEGMTVRDIAAVTGYSKTHIHRKLVKIAEIIIGDRFRNK